MCFLGLVLSSCRDEFSFSVPPEVTFNYNIQAELSPQNIVAIQLLETVPIGDQLKTKDRRDAIAFFSGPDIPGDSLDMAFNATSEKYHLLNEDFRVVEGNTYDVSILIPGETEEVITAQVTVPIAVTFDADIIGASQIAVDDEFSHYEIEVLIELEEPAAKPAYYRFTPYRLKSTQSSDPYSVSHTSEKQELVIADVLNNNNALEQLAQGGGITVDESRLSESILHLILRTKEPLRDGPSVDTKNGIDIIERFHFELTTMSPELYEYEKWVDRLLNQGASFSAPPGGSSNIQNASGFFGGSSRSLSFPTLD